MESSMLLYLIVLLASLASTISLVTHIYTFFRSTPSKQSFTTKNLTVYVFLLLLFYILVLLPSNPQLYRSPTHYHNEFLDMYFSLTITIFKFIIVLDIFLYFHKISSNQRPPSDDQNIKLLVYLILGTFIPLTYTFILKHMGWENEQSTGIRFVAMFPTLKIFRVSFLFPIFASVWCIRSASISKNELLTRYSVQRRLLVCIGVYSTLLNVAELFYAQFLAGPGEFSGQYSHFFKETNNFENFAASLEGVLIGKFFTTKADTFLPVMTTEYEATNQPSTSL